MTGRAWVRVIIAGESWPYEVNVVSHEVRRQAGTVLRAGHGLKVRGGLLHRDRRGRVNLSQGRERRVRFDPRIYVRDRGL